jgi:putative hydrolase of the HAD superfamily
MRIVDTVDAILLDLDDTLVAYDAVSEMSWRQVCNHYVESDGKVCSETLYQTISKHSSWFWSDKSRNRTGRQNMIQARRDIVSLAFSELELSGPDAVYVADHFSKIRIDNMFLLPNAPETLSYFKNMNLRLALVTNGESIAQRKKIDRFGLHRYFNSILIEAELGFGKPDSRIFMKALQALDSTPNRTIMIGDNLEWDIAGPQAVGIRAIWHDWMRKGIPNDCNVVPYRTIHTLSELRDTLENEL